jgi:hypothetical protein
MEERPQMTALTLPDRLRAHALTNVPMPVEEDMEEAARRIERLERELAEATRWNHAVRVCAEHTGDVVGDGCLVCENAALLEALRELVLVESVVLREYGSGSEHYQQRAIAAWAGAQTALESESPARSGEFCANCGKAYDDHCGGGRCYIQTEGPVFKPQQRRIEP